jgi:hypothetical protein
MPGVGFEPTIPGFDRGKTFHALDRAAAVLGAHAIKLAKITTGNRHVNTIASRLGGDKIGFWKGP